MKRREFHSLIQYLEDYATRHPRRYRWKLFGLALLGYFYLFGIVFLLGALLIALGAGGYYLAVHGRGGQVVIVQLLLKIGLPALVLLLIIVRSVRVRIPPPEGRELAPEEAPELFDLIESLRRQLHAPPIAKVILNMDFNAGISQIPMLGPLGWYRSYLCLGLPLMGAMTPEHFTAVLAHEFGHLSGNHGVFSSWIFRLRMTWVQVFNAMQQEEQSWGSLLFQRFLDWFVPYFDAYAYVITRKHEHASDRSSQEIVGAACAGEALILTDLRARYLESEFWPGLQNRAIREPQPPADGLSGLFPAIKANPSAAKAREWTAQALQPRTSIDDTHPCLADRLRRIGFDPQSFFDRLERADSPLAFPRGSAAEVFLARPLSAILEEVTQYWREAVAETWQDTHRKAQEEIRMFEELEKKGAAGELDGDDRWALICGIGKFRSEAEANSLLAAFLTAFPDHVQACFTQAMLLFDRNDPAALPFLEKAMQGDPDLVNPGCQAAWSFWHRRGEEEKAEGFQERCEAHQELVQRANEERLTLGPQDAYEPFEIDPESLERILALLGSFPEIEEAFFARKVVRLLPEKPFFVFAMVVRRSWWRFTLQDETSENQELVEKLAGSGVFSDNCLILCLGPQYESLQKTLAGLAGARILPRP